MVRTLVPTIALAFALTALPAAAAETAARADDLGSAAGDTLYVERDAVIDAALAHNEMLKASSAMTDAADADALGAWRGFLPRLSLGAYQIRSNDALYSFGFKLNQRRATQMDFSAPMMAGSPPPPQGDLLNHPGANENNIMQVKLQQPVFNGGMALYGKKAADAMGRAAASQHRRAEETVRFHAVQAYEGLVLAEAYEQVMLKALASADGHVDRARAMYDNEMVTEADLLQAEVYRDALAQRLIEVRNMARTAGEHIKLLTAVRTDLHLASAPGAPAPVDLSVEPVLQGAGLRSDVLASGEQAAAASHMTKVARGAMVPHLNLQAEKNWFHHADLFGDEADSWTFGVYATWDVFSGLENIGGLKKARAQSRAAEYMHDFQRRQANAEARQAAYDMDAAARKLEVARDAVTAAREGLRIVTNMHREGLASMVDLLDVQAAATMAEGNLVQARHDYDVGRARFEFAGGAFAARTPQAGE
jgi:outer membrane protein TolC